MQHHGEIVFVVGGGLSSAQAAIRALKRGAKRVILMSRREMQSRPYDLPLEWMDARLGWKSAGKDKDKSSKFRSFEYFETPKEERKAWVKSARGGATIPASYLEELDRVAKTGRLERFIDEIEGVEVLENGLIHLTFCHGNSPIVVDQVILATGTVLDISKVPLLQEVADRHNLPIVSQLPDVNEQLQWGDENFSVVGAFAMLQNGPDSGNLTGCRRAAAICAESLGAFKSFDHYSCGPLANPFSALLGEDTASETDSNSASDDEDDVEVEIWDELIDSCSRY